MQNDEHTSRTPLECDIEIGRSDTVDYPVIIRSPGGDAEGTFRLPYGGHEMRAALLEVQNAILRSSQLYRKAFTPQAARVQEFGQKLFDALFIGEVRTKFEISLERAQREQRGLRIRLRLRSSELAVLPWEFLYDARSDQFLCLSRATPIIRYPEVPRVIQPLTVAPPLRILGMIASPKSHASLDIEREKKALETALAEPIANGVIELGWVDGQTYRDLQRTLRRQHWHVFHFIGHGGFDTQAEEGLLIFGDSNGDSQRVHAGTLANLLADHPTLGMAVLNACETGQGSSLDLFSSSAAVLVRRGIRAALAMQFEISDEAAIEFAQCFYESLADNLPVDAAVAEARKAILGANERSLEWGTPVLYMLARDGMLFRMGESPIPPVTAGVPAIPTVRQADIPAQQPAPITGASATQPPADTSDAGLLEQLISLFEEARGKKA